MLHFEKVNDDIYNEVINIKCKRGQEGFMETVKEVMEEYEEDKKQWTSVALYDDSIMVGYALYGCCCKGKYTWLDDILIDEKYQHKGYGTSFIKMFISFLRKKFSNKEIYLSVFKENTDAISLYEKLGFHFINQYDSEGELIYVYDK